jgi:hypothetical protein
MKNITAAMAATVVISLLLPRCAKVGAPTGGIRDTTPPKYVKGIPENRSTHFIGEEINFWFDEYVQFKDLNKELLISPPLKERPDIRIKEKSVRVELNNDLLPGTTYTINFGNALSDINESNLLPDFEFVFSTGDQIDSLAIAGQALNAFDHKPLKDEEILVMLYDDLSDSAPMVKEPRYIGRANKFGLFSINNIHPDTCMIIALQDANSNMKYDPGSESVAFLDSFLILDATTVKPLHFIKDTIKIKKTDKKKEPSGKPAPVKESVDTTIVQGKTLNALNVSLYYFPEEMNEVYLTSRKRDLPEKLLFSFSRTPHDSVQIRPLNYNAGSSWFLAENSINRDSLVYWITDSLMAGKDTLVMELSFTTTDSSGNFVITKDTISLRFQKPDEKSTSGRKSRTSIVKDSDSRIKLTASISNRGTQNLNKPVVFTTDKPLSIINRDSIELYEIEDSIITRQSFTCLSDTTNIRRFNLVPTWKENTKYRLLLKPYAVMDIYGHTNDSVEIKFVTQKAEHYGSLIITASSRHFPLILQIIDQKGHMVDSRNVKLTDRIVVGYLSPGKYTLKAIVDSNHNGRWDTGNFLERRQPEQVFFYNLPIDLRSNWDFEVSWELPD